MLGKSFDDSKPIFIQIKERIEDQIMNDQLQVDEQVPSTTQLVQFYKINHTTILKGLNLLVQDEIIYKKRDVGMFVKEDAKDKLIHKRKAEFVNHYLLPLVQEATKLGIDKKELSELLNQIERSE